MSDGVTSHWQRESDLFVCGYLKAKGTPYLYLLSKVTRIISERCSVYYRYMVSYQQNLDARSFYVHALCFYFMENLYILSMLIFNIILLFAFFFNLSSIPVMIYTGLSTISLKPDPFYIDYALIVENIFLPKVLFYPQ